ncbi:RNA methyltransferase, partial [Mesorhizobium sp. M7A.F.Ca.CA.001.04.1.1]
RDGWPSEKARAAASRADHVIDAVTVFDDLASALADLNFVFATTARQRDGFKSVRGPVEAGRMLRTRHAMGQRTGILFGRERFGLYNDEVGLADEIVTFPVDPDFSSLNIAQAALLMSYEWMKSGLEDETKTNFSGPDMKPASKEELHGLFAYLEGALEARGYFRPAPKKPKMIDNLRAVLTRAGFAEPELKVLRGIISSLDRFSPAMPRGDGSPGDDPRRLPAAAARARKAEAARLAGAGKDDDIPPLGGKGTDND